MELSGFVISTALNVNLNGEKVSWCIDMVYQIKVRCALYRKIIIFYQVIFSKYLTRFVNVS